MGVQRGGNLVIDVQTTYFDNPDRAYSAALGNFDFGPFIGRNLMESGTVFAQT